MICWTWKRVRRRRRNRLRRKDQGRNQGQGQRKERAKDITIEGQDLIQGKDIDIHQRRDIEIGDIQKEIKEVEVIQIQEIEDIEIIEIRGIKETIEMKEDRNHCHLNWDVYIKER